MKTLEKYRLEVEGKNFSTEKYSSEAALRVEKIINDKVTIDDIYIDDLAEEEDRADYRNEHIFLTDSNRNLIEVDLKIRKHSVRVRVIDRGIKM